MEPVSPAVLQTFPVNLLAGVGRHIAKALLVPPPGGKQGTHLDPLDLPKPDSRWWPKDQRRAWESGTMAVFRDCLRFEGLDVREAVLDDLATYHRLSPDECRERCLNWEKWSVEEWSASDRSTPEGLQAFYDSVQSWSFDLLWYGYLQSSGFGFPVSPLSVRFAQERCPNGNHLDFGSGVGLTSQLFGRLGFTTTLADVSKSLLDFAAFRLERRGDRASYLNLTSAELPTAEYDVVTAVDTLVHVPDFDKTVRDLHRAIRPNGYLLTNFDVRPKDVVESAWHLYDDSLELEYRLLTAGFAFRAKLGGVTSCFQKVDPSGTAHRLRSLRDRIVLRPPGSTLVATGRRIRWPTADRLRRKLVLLLEKAR
jgi:SAM-dependent methyltransferase